MDLCNDLNFLLVFLLGFALTAADDEGMKEVIERGRWYNFIIGRIKKQSGQIYFLTQNPYAIKNQRMARNALSRGLWVP